MAQVPFEPAGLSSPMRLVDKTIILMMSRAMGSMNVLVLSIFFARMLSKADYGAYIQFNMIIQPLGIILALGLPPSFNYYLPKEFNRKHLVFRTFGFLFLVGNLCLLLLVLFKSRIGALLNNPAIEPYMQYAGLCVISLVCFQVIRPLLVYRDETVKLALIEFIRSVLLFASMIACLFIMPQITTLIIVFTANHIVGFLIAAVVIYITSNEYRGDRDHTKLVLTRQLYYGLPLAFSGIFWLLGRELDKYIVSHFLKPDELAVYSRGAIELPLVHILSSTIAQVNLPRWVEMVDRNDHTQMMESWHQTINKTALIMFPIFILMEVIGRDFIVLLYSEKYVDSVIIFIIYLFLLPLQITSYTAIVQAFGKNKFILYGYAVQIIFNLVISIYLIKIMGTLGPALTTVFSMYLWTSYIIFIISRLLSIKIKTVFPWRYLMIILFVSGVAGVFPAYINYTFETHEEFILMLKMGGLALMYLLIYLLLLFKFKMLDEEDKETIYRWFLIEKVRPVFNKIKF